MTDHSTSSFNPMLRNGGPRSRRRNRAEKMSWMHSEAEDGFTCRYCGAFVCSAIALAGVIHRNHCPYCLWSRHLDLERAGDRLSACKAPMRPIGLIKKKTPKKYRNGAGELMIVHRCTGCERVSINRLAADDDPETLLAVFKRSLEINSGSEEIQMLGQADRPDIEEQLFGRR